MVRNDSGPGAGRQAGNAPALEHSPQYFERLIEGVRDCAIFMLDPAGLVVSWNPGAERIKGYSAEEILGRHFSEFYTQEDRSGDLPGRALRIAETTGKFELYGDRKSVV